MQSASPRIGHQRIASNFERHLNTALRLNKPEWRADREIGIEVSPTSRNRPEPEVTVIDTCVDPEQNYASEFYLVMEVPSSSDRGSILDAKIDFYRSHPSNLFVIVVEQDCQTVVVHSRIGPDAWSRSELGDEDDVLELPGIGPVCTIADLYENTRFDPRSYPKGPGPG